MNRNRRTWILLGAIALFAACAPGDPQFTAETPAGFWLGVWHGAIAWITLVVGLFVDGVEIYERSNTGAWYDLGFIIGVSCIGGGGTKASGRRSPRSKKPE